ncbi:MAG: efflux RND transporter permease subunit [Lachnospiraceae bacterium]|nr:efflux RND transporter permease subunit [Lachnospiraceae bacterium]
MPDINLPYVVVMTTYVGASPETVEAVVTSPVEASMATISNIEGIESMSSENYSVVILEFSQKANMDSVSLDIRESLDQLKSYWPDEVGSPIIMKLNPNMLPIMIAAVGVEDMTQAEAGDFVEDKIVPEIESVEGVASVSTTGIIEESLHVVISEDKISKLNDKVEGLIDEKFEEAYEELADAKKELEDGESKLADAEKEIKKGEEQLADAEKKVEDGRNELNDKKTEANAELANAKLQLLTAKADLEAAKMDINTNLTTLDALVSARAEIVSKRAEVEKQRQSLVDMIDQMEQMETLLTTTIPDSISGILMAYAGGIMDAATANAALAAIQAQLAATPIGTAFAAVDFTVSNASLLAEVNGIITGYLSSSEYTEGKAQLTDGLTKIDDGLAQIDAGIKQIDDNIASTTMGLGVDAYKSAQQGALDQIEANLALVDDGIIQLYQGENEAIIAFANGLSQLDLTNYQLAVSRAELAEGKNTLEGSKQQLEDAKTQIEDGLDQLDDAKTDAKEKADMTAVLSVETISGLLTAQNFSMPAGYVQEDGNSYLVRVGDKPSTEEELKKMVLMKIPMTDDEIITLADVADIFTTNNANKVYTNVNGRPGIVLSIQKQTGYSTGNVSDALLAKFDDLRERYTNTDIIQLMDQGVYIDLVMNTIFENVLVGGLLAIIVLIFFLRDIRPTLVIAISIPVSLIAALVLMYFSGVSLNIISLSGLALGVGMLVDNSIVVIENIYRMRNLGVEPKEAAIKGAKEVAGAIFASTLTTVCVFLPIVFTEGLTRQLFVDMGLTIAYSLLASLAVALTVVPACASGMLKKVKKTKSREDSFAYRAYEKFLRGCLKVKPIVLLVAIGLLGISVYAAYTNGFAYFPAMDSTQVTVSVGIAEESDIEDVKEATDIIIERIAEIEDVVDIGALASRGSLSLFGAQSSDEVVPGTTIYVTTTEKRTMTSQELSNAIKDCASDLEGITVSVETSTMDMSAMGGSGISISIKGRDLDTLYKLAQEAGKIISETEGVGKVSSDTGDASPELRVHVDREKAAVEGLTVAQAFMQIADYVKDSSVATTLTTATNDISVYVDDETRSNLSRNDIRDMEITYTNADGEEDKVPLSEIADYEDGVGMSTINRVDQTRYVSINAAIADGYNVTFVTQDVEKNMKALEIPAGYSLEFGGENEMIMDSMRQLALLLVLAVLFIYLIMVAQFQSLGSPFIIMFTIPLAFTGGFGALFLTGSEISIVVMIGFVMLSGIIVNNGIVLVDYINQRRAEGLSKKEAIIDAGITRLRPVLMTAMTTILALLTMAFSKKMGADMTKPLAIVVIGGMIYGTLMTLIVVPCIYDIFVREKKKKDVLPEVFIGGNMTDDMTEELSDELSEEPAGDLKEDSADDLTEDLKEDSVGDLTEDLPKEGRDDNSVDDSDGDSNNCEAGSDDATK